jgi:hypothetical protein
MNWTDFYEHIVLDTENINYFKLRVTANGNYNLLTPKYCSLIWEETYEFE